MAPHADVRFCPIADIERGHIFAALTFQPNLKPPL